MISIVSSSSELSSTLLALAALNPRKALPFSEEDSYLQHVMARDNRLSIYDVDLKKTTKNLFKRSVKCLEEECSTVVFYW